MKTILHLATVIWLIQCVPGISTHDFIRDKSDTDEFGSFVFCKGNHVKQLHFDDVTTDMINK